MSGSPRWPLWLPVLLIAAAACAPAPPPPTPDPVVRGSELFASSCAACHGEQAQGGAGPAPALDGSAHAWHHPDQQLYDFICRGKPGAAGVKMPAFGDQLSPEEIGAVIAYFQSLWPEDLLALQAETTERVLGEFPPCP